MELNDFKTMIAKKSGHKRKTVVSNSYGLNDYYKYYKEESINNNNEFLSYKDFSAIIKSINNKIRDKFTNGYVDFKFPYQLGKLEIVKIPIIKKIVDGKLKTTAFVDWSKTMELWFEDKEAFDNKQLVKSTNNNIFRIKYDRVCADFTNKVYTDFYPNRELKNKLKENIRSGKIDAYVV